MLLNATLSTITQVSAHAVGNRNNGEALKLSEDILVIDDELHSLLKKYFLAHFQTPEYYAFTFSNGDFSLNPVFQFAARIFADPRTLHDNSVNIAQHLYAATQHPNIRAGDLYVAHVEGLSIDNDLYDAVGIFKSESKDSFLKLSKQFTLSAHEGVNINKLDKGCLILNAEADAGFKVLIVDNLNKADAQFWKTDFLNIAPRSDAFHHTSNFMNLTRQYVADQLQEEFSVSQADKIDLLNRSVDFFKSREQFNQAEFEADVLGNADVIESFRNYGRNFMASNEFDPADNFEISAQAVKRQARIFKSVLKLDKNFHVYIHGNRELIEKGFDEVIGKHYYKLYFDNES